MKRYRITPEGWRVLEGVFGALTNLASKDQLEVEDSKTRWHVFNETRKYARERRAEALGLKDITEHPRIERYRP